MSWGLQQISVYLTERIHLKRYILDRLDCTVPFCKVKLRELDITGFIQLILYALIAFRKKHKTCSSPRRTIFIHVLTFECTSKLCITLLNQFSVYFHI